MFCTNCGKELADGTKICDGCNTVLDETPAQEPFTEPTPEPRVDPVYTAPTNVVNNFYQEKREPVSVMGWIGRSLINCIPLVGPIIYFIMLFIWSGDKTKEASFNNWAKAQLILMLIAIGIVLLIFLVVLIISLITAGSIAGYSSMY